VCELAFHHCDKVPEKIHLRGGKFYFGLVLKGSICCWMNLLLLAYGKEKHHGEGHEQSCSLHGLGSHYPLQGHAPNYLTLFPRPQFLHVLPPPSGTMLVMKTLAHGLWGTFKIQTAIGPKHKVSVI
jgi:hypothetical protein